MFGWLRKRKPPAAAPPRTWRDAALFRGLAAEELEMLAPHVAERRVDAGVVLAGEGTPVTELYLIDEGSLELCKRDPLTGEEHRIDEVGAGEVVGEVALFDGLPRVTTVRAVSRTRLVVLPFEVLRRLAAPIAGEANPAAACAYRKLLVNLTAVLADRARAQAGSSLEQARERAAMGRFLLVVLVGACLYAFLLSGLALLSGWLPASTSWVSIPVQLAFGVGAWRFMRSTGYPMERFGMSWRHLLASLAEATVLTLPLLALITGVKWLLLLGNGNPRGQSLIANPDVVARLGDHDVLGLLVVYALSSVVQEIIVRGALQSSLQMFLSGPRRVRHAVLVSALLFSMMHLHMSFLFAALAFLPGLFWGWLFARRPHVAGVSLSHVLVGGYVFFVLGVGI